MTRLVVASLVVVLASACGPSKRRSSDDPPRPAPKAPEASPAAPQGVIPAAGPAARFALLRPYFLQFTRRPIDGKTNLFRSNLAQFAPRVEIDTEVERPEAAEPKTPLEYFDVDQYKLVLIMSGTALSKALVVDPKGKSYILQEGTKIGTRAGKVTSITATEVRIDEPGRPTAVKALELGTAEMARALQSVEEY